VVACFADIGQYNKIILYAKKVGYNPDYMYILQQIIRGNAEAGIEFAKMLVTEDGIEVELERVIQGGYYLIPARLIES